MSLRQLSASSTPAPFFDSDHATPNSRQDSLFHPAASPSFTSTSLRGRPNRDFDVLTPLSRSTTSLGHRPSSSFGGSHLLAVPAHGPSSSTTRRLPSTQAPYDRQTRSPSSSPGRHVCSVCTKSFARPSALAVHMNTHVRGLEGTLCRGRDRREARGVETDGVLLRQTGATPYVCEHCGLSFNVLSNLRR